MKKLFPKIAILIALVIGIVRKISITPSISKNRNLETVLLSPLISPQNIPNPINAIHNILNPSVIYSAISSPYF